MLQTVQEINLQGQKAEHRGTTLEMEYKLVEVQETDGVSKMKQLRVR